jgi:hypothetical protein
VFAYEQVYLILFDIVGPFRNPNMCHTWIPREIPCQSADPASVEVCMAMRVAITLLSQMFPPSSNGWRQRDASISRCGHGVFGNSVVETLVEARDNAPLSIAILQRPRSYRGPSPFGVVNRMLNHR